MEARSREIDIGRVIGEAFSLYGAQAATLLGVAAVVIGIPALIQGVLSISGDPFLFFLVSVISIVAGVLYTGFVVKLVEDVRDGRRDSSVGELLSAAAPFIGTLFLNGILYGLAVGIGLVLLIVPGLILLTIWAVTAPAIVSEGRGPIEAFGRSRELVRGNGWSVFAVIVVTFLITIVISGVIAAIGAALGDAGSVIFRFLGSVIAAPIGALVSAVLFFDLGGGGAAAATATPATTPPPPPPAPPQGPAA